MAKLPIGRNARTKSPQLTGSFNVGTTTVHRCAGEAVAVLLAKAPKEIVAYTAAEPAAIRQHELTTA